MKDEQNNEYPKVSRMCILCKEKPATGLTTTFYCETCMKEDGLVRFAALQRHTKFDETILEYQKDCWEKEKVLITSKELLKRLRKKCNSFSPEHRGFKQMIEEIKQSHASTPKLIKAKIKLRNQKKKEIIEVKNLIKLLKSDIEKIKNQKSKANKEKYKKLVIKLKYTIIEKEKIEKLLEKLKRKRE